jgi:predicted acylesterase/phospholipase RssA
MPLIDEGKKPVEDPLDTARVLLAADRHPDLETVLQVCKGLKRKQQFRTARRLLERAGEHPSLKPGGDRPEAIKLAQLHAFCHSRDTSLTYRRHAESVKLLRERAGLEFTTNKETLGIAGGIFKRMWARTGQTRFLTQGLNCYERGYASQDSEGDYGYNGINAAFLNDQLAIEDDGRTRLERCQHAQHIRERLVKDLPPLLGQKKWLEGEWWFLVTVAEALLGLHCYSAASEWLRKAQALTVDDWEKQATATQLAVLCRLHDHLDDVATVSVTSGPVSSPSAAVGSPATAREVMCSAFPGVPVHDLGLKMGIALSGGGFRASFYHLGVLARLADEDQLRRVEVISCVSGGSIVGALYYLEVRNLLQRNKDGAIGPEDYIKVVRRVTDSFLAGVQRNLRTRVLASPRVSLEILFADQTRTKYLGDLFEAELYAQVKDDHPKGAPRWLDELVIKPLGEPDDFHPRSHNWRRNAKVPALILNATTLNTGHLWQFTATWMGEPPASINPLSEFRERLRRLGYGEAPTPFQRVRLGHAVAASACVPGLFEPLELDGLYPNRKVCLVDGGVFDNQGVEGLLGEECQDLLVSDASGPLTAEAIMTAGRIGVPVRSNAIAMNLVRDRQYQNLDGLVTASSLRRVRWVHLAQGVAGGATVDWHGCKDGSLTHQPETQPRKVIDQKISAIRTDLDAFSDAEAYVLMTNGYRTIQRASTVTPPADGVPRDTDWRFLSIEKAMDESGCERAHQRLLVLLRASSQTLFKIWYIVPWLPPATALLASLIVGGLLYGGWNHTGYLTIRVRSVVAWVLVALAGAVVLYVSRRVVRTHASLWRLAVTVVALVAWIPARLQLHLLDPLFLWLGSFDRLLPDRRAAASTSVPSSRVTGGS